MNHEMASFFDNISHLDCFSDTYRLVDPVKKKVIEDNQNTTKFHQPCYDFWERNKVCDNCISMRAYNNNATYVKIEYSQDRVFLITAIPQVVDNQHIVLENFKDITSSMFPGATFNDGAETAGIHALVNNMNKLTYKELFTGFYNGRYISEKLPADLLSTSLASKNLSIILADLDHFSAINDRFGRSAGDHTLKYFAGLLTQCIRRENDWVARYSDTRFLICMPGADLDIALSVAERIRSTLEHSTIICEDSEFQITASFGVYCMTPTGHDHVEDILNHAEQRLLMAKSGGRNRIEY